MTFLYLRGGILDMATLSVPSHLLKLGNSSDPFPPLPVLEWVTSQISVSLLHCGFCPFWKSPVFPGARGPQPALVLHRQLLPSLGWRTRDMPRCRETRQVLQCFSQVQNKRRVLDWACWLWQYCYMSGAPTETCILALFESAQPCVVPGGGGRCVQLCCRCAGAGGTRCRLSSRTRVFVPSGKPKLRSMWLI